jgi:anaerobic selenocysteine-containing dehydrogenase
MSANVLDRALTRRQFLKATAATAALATLSDRLLSSQPQLVAEAASVPAQDEWLHSLCRMCTQNKCATLVHVKDGVVVQIEGDPAGPLNLGTLCPRGNAAIFNLYNPYRVKSPVKRTNPQKGLDQDPKWVEISWDEALNAVSDRLKKIISEDPRKVVFSTGFGSQQNVYGPVSNTFYSVLGMPGDNKVPSNGPMCSVHLASCMVQAAFTNGPDHIHCNYLITVGSSIGANWATSGGSVRAVMDALDRGMKLVVVDPRAGKEAAMGEWVPIRPGSELAFMLGLINVMLYEIGLVKLDVAFLKRRSNAPYLIGTNERYVRDSSTKKPLIWDPTDSKAKVFDDPTIKDYALEGEFQVAGQTVRTGLTLIKSELKSNTPEWQETITTIPAATVRRIANEFVAAAQVGSTITLDGIEFPLRPAMIWPKRGALDQQDGGYVMFAAKVINELVGAMDVPGGDQNTQTWGPFLKPTEDGTVTPVMEGIGTPWKFPPDNVQLSSFFPFKHSSPYLAWRVILDPKSLLFAIRSRDDVQLCQQSDGQQRR